MMMISLRVQVVKKGIKNRELVNLNSILLYYIENKKIRKHKKSKKLDLLSSKNNNYIEKIKEIIDFNE